MFCVTDVNPSFLWRFLVCVLIQCFRLKLRDGDVDLSFFPKARAVILTLVRRKCGKLDEVTSISEYSVIHFAYYLVKKMSHSK